MNDHAAPLEGLPVFGTSWDPAHLDFPADADFQTGIGDWILRGELEDPADALMGGHAAPRLWLLLHEPGEGRLAAVAALALARELMGRDQAVLVLDCDEEDALLSGWADRNEQEGWIDLVRYGASLLTCGVRLPFSGRQGLLLGPGSYRPVDAQPAEIEQLLARLRRQADDILLCCPIGESGRSWAGQADVRLLCWDSGRADGPQLESLAQGFARAGTPLTGIVRFGDEEIAGGGIAAPAAEEETADLDVEQAIEALEEQAAEEAESVDPAAEPSTPEPEPASTPEPEPAPTPERGPSPDFGEDVPGLQRPTGAEPDLYARKRGTSRVFWWIAAAAVVLIAGSFWYYREYVMVQPLDSEPRVARHEARPAEGTGGIDVATSTGPQDGAPVQPGAEEAAGQAGAQEGAAAGNDEQAEAPATTTSEPEATAPRGPSRPRPSRRHRWNRRRTPKLRRPGSWPPTSSTWTRTWCPWARRAGPCTSTRSPIRRAPPRNWRSCIGAASRPRCAPCRSRTGAAGSASTWAASPAARRRRKRSLPC